MTDAPKLVHLAITANFWGKGDSPGAAVLQLHKAGGTTSSQKYGYSMYQVHPDTVVDPVDGSLRYPKGADVPKLLHVKKGRKSQ